jgi:hypothetical protein
MKQNKKGLALFFKPPPLLEIPSFIIIREIFLNDLHRRRLIQLM